MPTMDTYYGRGLYKTLTGDISLVRGSPRVLVIDPNGPGRIITLPDETKLRLGGPHFYIINTSVANSIMIRQQNNYTVITLNPEKAAEICLIRHTTISRWFVQEHDFIGDAAGYVTP